MLIHRSIIGLFLAATPVIAQNRGCGAGPGALFGISGYQCANCGFKQELGSTATFTFFSEPVVTDTRPGSAVASGDVIIAVDGNPITTQTGADRFAHPAAGSHTLTVRRGRDRQDIRVDLQTNCTPVVAGIEDGRLVRGARAQGGGGSASGGTFARAGGGGSGFGGSDWNVSGSASVSGGFRSNAVGSSSSAGPAASEPCDSLFLSSRVRVRGVTRLGGRDVAIGDTVTFRPDPVVYIDGVRVTDSATLANISRVNSASVARAEGGRFGFAIDTKPVCRMTNTNGRRTYSEVFEDYPAIYAVRAGSVAEKAGLRVGDVITKVEGKPVLENPMLLTGADYRNDLHLVVRRDGKEISVVMLVTP